MKPKTNHPFHEYNKYQPFIKRLIECPTEVEFKVLRVNVGYYAKRRLACLGIIPGVKIKMKRTAPFRGPVEVIVKGTSLVIGRGLASKINVIDANSS
ncbi:MAG: ferrous iron transport protein A [Candidatus Thorarchaeota archaeon]